MDVFSYVNFEIGGLIGSFVSPSEKIEINGADLSARYIYINEDSKTLDTVKLRVLTRLVLKQIAYEGDFRSLCTVTFSQKVDFLIINAH